MKKINWSEMKSIKIIDGNPRIFIPSRRIRIKLKENEFVYRDINNRIILRMKKYYKKYRT